MRRSPWQKSKKERGERGRTSSFDLLHVNRSVVLSGLSFTERGPVNVRPSVRAPTPRTSLILLFLSHLRIRRYIDVGVCTRSERVGNREYEIQKCIVLREIYTKVDSIGG